MRPAMFDVTKEDILRHRAMRDCGLHSAVRAARKEKALAAVAAAQSTDDLKRVLAALVEELWS
jgi:hypothetical protein